MAQHMDALAKANRVRFARAALRADLASGKTTVADVMAAMPPEAVTMSVYSLLVAQHRWGRQRAVRVLKAMHVGEQRPLGDLTERQRGLLLLHVSVSRMASGARPKADR
jgi:hypothetical protein